MSHARPIKCRMSGPRASRIGRFRTSLALLIRLSDTAFGAWLMAPRPIPSVSNSSARAFDELSFSRRPFPRANPAASRFLLLPASPARPLSSPVAHFPQHSRKSPAIRDAETASFSLFRPQSSAPHLRRGRRAPRQARPRRASGRRRRRRRGRAGPSAETRPREVRLRARGRRAARSEGARRCRSRRLRRRRLAGIKLTDLFRF